MPRKRLHGFTLVELLVVVSLIVLLIAMLLPAVGRARDAARTAACAANMRQVYMGLSMYAADNRGLVPPASFQELNPPYTWRTWVNPLLTYLPSTMTRSIVAMPKVFICPSETVEPAGRSSYGINPHLGDDLGNSIPAIKPDKSKDGSNGWYRLPSTVRPVELYLFADAGVNSAGGQLYYMTNPALDDVQFFNVLRHPGPRGLNVTYADGHVDNVPHLATAVWQKIPWWNR
jgi:prepilin-type N-terminal cleavage/methylation domain-containing protein/prepilin-type processing-associated H-X9-DG protein